MLSKTIKLAMLMLLLMPACKTLNRSVDEIKLVCGESSGKSGIYIELARDSGEELKYADLRTFEFGYLEDSGELKKIGRLTNRGCFQFESNTNFKPLYFYSASLNLAATVSDVEKGQFYRVIAKTLDPPEFSLACPDSGVFGNLSIENPWKLRLTSSQYYQLNIQARKIDSNESFTVFSKKFGSKPYEYPVKLDLGELPEGQFVLESSLESLRDNSLKSANLNLFGNQSSCRVNIIKHPPPLNLVSGELPISKPNELMPWSVIDETAVFRSCTTTNPGFSDCRLVEGCDDLEKFHNGPLNAPSTPGIYRSYFYHEDKAKNRSEVQCRVLVVANARPIVDVLWNNEKWNTPISSVERPYGILTARAVVSNLGLPSEVLGNRLECKVEFQNKGKLVIKGSDAICRSGRCSGKNLAEYQPCDKDLVFQIDEAYRNEYALNSLLRVKYRLRQSDDHEALGEANVWIIPNRWSVEKSKQQRGDPVLAADSYKEWIKFGFYDVGGTIWGLWQNPSSSMSSSLVTRSIDGKWAEESEVKDFDITRAAVKRFRDKTYLIDESSKKIVLLKKDGIEFRQLPNSPSAQACNSSGLLLSSVDNQFAIVCQGKIEIKLPKDDDWKVISEGVLKANERFSSGVLQGDSLTAILERKNESNATRIISFDFLSGKLESFPVPVDLSGGCEFDEASNLFCNDSKWDVKTHQFVFENSARLLRKSSVAIRQRDGAFTLPLFDERDPTYAERILDKSSLKITVGSMLELKPEETGFPSFEFDPGKLDSRYYPVFTENASQATLTGNLWAMEQILPQKSTYFKGQLLLNRRHAIFGITRNEIVLFDDGGNPKTIFQQPEDATGSKLSSVNPDEMLEDSNGALWFSQLYFTAMSSTGYLFSMDENSFQRIPLVGFQDQSRCLSLFQAGDWIHCYTENMRHFSISIRDKSQVQAVNDVFFNAKVQSNVFPVLKTAINSEWEVFLVDDNSNSSEPNLHCRLLIRPVRAYDQLPIQIPFSETDNICKSNLYQLENKLYLQAKSGIYQFKDRTLTKILDSDTLNFRVVKIYPSSGVLLHDSIFRMLYF